jgi:iron(III) transport system permease protein
MGVMGATSSRGSARTQALRHRVALVLIIAVIGYLVVMPMFRLQSLALQDGFSGYHRFLDLPNIDRVVVTTVKLAIGSLLIAMGIGTLLAWMALRLPRRLQWMSSIPVLPMVIPGVASVTGWAFLLSPVPGYLNQLIRSLPGVDARTGPFDVYSVTWIVIITGLSLSSFVYLFVRAGLRNVSMDLIEAGRVCGSSPGATFRHVTLPLIRPSLIFGGMIAFLLGLGQVTAPLLLGGPHNVQVLTTQLYEYSSQGDYAIAAAIGSPLLLAGLLAVLCQRLLLGETSRFVSHSGRGFRPSSETSGWSALAIGVFGVIAVGLPLVALVIVALSPYWSGKVDPGVFTLANFDHLFHDAAVMDAIKTSIFASASATAIALVVGFVLATVLLRERKHRVLRTIIDFIVTMPLGIPAVIFGAGFLFTYTRPPLELYGTRWVIVLVYVTLMLPFTTRLQLAGMVGLGTSYEEAARTAGAGRLRTKLQIVLPLMRATLGSAAALMLVLLSHEFAASALVRSVDTQVMGTKLADIWVNGLYPGVAAFALVMCAVTAVGLLLATAIGGRGAINRL